VTQRPFLGRLKKHTHWSDSFPHPSYIWNLIHGGKKCKSSFTWSRKRGFKMTFMGREHCSRWSCLQTRSKAAEAREESLEGPGWFVLHPGTALPPAVCFLGHWGLLARRGPGPSAKTKFQRSSSHMTLWTQKWTEVVKSHSLSICQLKDNGARQLAKGMEPCPCETFSSRVCGERWAPFLHKGKQDKGHTVGKKQRHRGTEIGTFLCVGRQNPFNTDLTNQEFSGPNKRFSCHNCVVPLYNVYLHIYFCVYLFTVWLLHWTQRTKERDSGSVSFVYQRIGCLLCPQ
jgi:hypothetical protein